MTLFSPHTLGKVLVAALGYWLCGQISSIYAIPPGFASPIWPAAGFALLVTLYWGRIMVVGIFAASLLLNVQFSQGALAPISMAWLTGAMIAVGSSLQVLVAVYAVRRLTCFPSLISRTRDALLLGALGGPLACLISATFGVTSLLSTGVIASQDYLHNWLTWWVGDSIGVMVFAPVVLTLNIRQHRGKSAKTWGFLTLYFALICLATLTFLFAKKHDLTSAHDILAERTSGYLFTLKKQLDAAADNAQSVVAVFEAFPTVERSHFVRYSSSLYSHIPGTQALSWIPIVNHADRDAYEHKLLTLQGTRPYFFKTDNAQGVMPVAAKSHYYPVYYIYPAEGNQAAIGFDLSSHAGRKAALERAIASGKQVATEPIELVQEQGKQKAFLLFSPIKQQGQTTGFISMVYRIEDLVRAALGDDVLARYAVTVVDATVDKAVTLMGEGGANATGSFRYTLQFAERSWTISFEPGLGEVGKLQSWWVWFTLVFAFMFVTLLGLLFLLILSRAAAIEQEVDIKTLALSEALEQARQSSQVKSAFLASMSHELRTPLNSIIGFSHRLLKTLSGTVEDRYIDYIGAINRNGHSLLVMINDILDLSRVEAGKLSVEKRPEEINPLVEEVLQALLPAAEDGGVTLQRELSPVKTLPLDRQRFTQVLTNLVGNAIKFAKQGQVSIHFCEKYVVDQTGLEIEVRDNGIGIAEEDLPKLFQRYAQLGDTFQGGAMSTGLGLALVRELVELHGGIVYVRSQVGKGSSFFAWFPLSDSDRR